MEVQVFHDIWRRYSFTGRPHPEVHARNAPRLAAALRGIEEALGVATESGEGTYFGHSEGYGIADPDPDELDDGLYFDATDRM